MVEKGFLVIKQNKFLELFDPDKAWCLDPHSQGTKPFKPKSMLQMHSVLQQQWLSRKVGFGI